MTPPALPAVRRHPAISDQGVVAPAVRAADGGQDLRLLKDLLRPSEEGILSH
jgi:hypothetical protein